MSALAKVLSLEDFEAAAQRHLPGPVFAYISGAAERNESWADNLAAFRDYGFVPRTLVDISKRSLETRILDQTFSAPFGIAPMGLSALSAYRGDVVLAQAARSARIPMIMSGSSLIRMEDVAAVDRDVWFQAYLPGQDDEIRKLIARIAAAGFKTLVITVDTPVGANRENNVRAGFSTPLRPSLRLAWEGVSHPRWTFGTFLRTLRHHGIPHFENNYASRGAPIISATVDRDFSDRGHLDWRHFAMIRQSWTGRLIVKGILAAEDAVKAVNAGVDAIIVSNHGGRQLDGSVAPLRVLPGIVAACPSIPIMIDSGFRRGTDVLKAIALGARMVFVGRPFAYAAAVGGEQGVTHGIELLRNEVSRDLAMLGLTSVRDLDADRHLYRKWPPST